MIPILVVLVISNLDASVIAEHKNKNDFVVFRRRSIDEDNGFDSPFSSSWRHDTFEGPNFDYFRDPFDFADGRDDDLKNNGIQLASIDSAKPRFRAGTWSSCSVTCGVGVRSRIVECVAFRGIISEMVKLPDFECDGQTKPILFESCGLPPCQTVLLETEANSDGKGQINDSSIGNLSAINGQVDENVGLYRWTYGEWTPCSSPCLGGKQKSTLKCIDMNKKTNVSVSFCGTKQRPIELSRTCNNHACPPSWEIDAFSGCSHSCGGGIRSRRVRCVRAVSRVAEAESTLILPDSQCPLPKPKNQEPCGIIDCPPTWKISRWSECSASCNAGEQHRTATCEQRDAFGQVREFDSIERCLDEDSNQSKPSTVRLCNLGPCNELSANDDELALQHQNDVITDEDFADSIGKEFGRSGDKSVRHIYGSDFGTGIYNTVTNTSLHDSFEQSQQHHKKLTLDVGGFATLYEGTSIKVKCPTQKNYAREDIYWTRNGERIVNNAHMKVSTNGALRIFHARMEDAGFYACYANGARGNVTLAFKHRSDNDDFVSKTSHILSNKTKFKTTTKSKSNANSSHYFDNQLIQKVQNNLQRIGEQRIYEKLNSINDLSQIKLDFAIGEWSPCSQLDCGRPDGAQVRMLKCRIFVEQLMAYVDDEICESFGVIRPPATRACHEPSCPRWEASDWTQCSESRCLRHSTALQRRTVDCVHSNGTKAEIQLCDRKNRPKIKKECTNLNCTAEWRPSAWGKCSKDCGDGGVQMRLLRCVWHGTRKAAGRHCNSVNRPPAIRMCDARSLKLAKCPPGSEDLDNNTFQLRKSTLTSNNQKSEFSISTSSTLATTISTKFITSKESATTTMATAAVERSNNSILDYSTWKSRQKVLSDSPIVEQKPEWTKIGSPIMEPFKNWERWRGWRLYNWPEPYNQFHRLADRSYGKDSEFYRKF